MGASHNKGTLNWGPYYKDPTTWATIFGSPISENPQILPEPGPNLPELGKSILKP